jgi:hypothetical protein
MIIKMAKFKRRVIGSVLKSKDGGPDYIQIRKDLKEPLVLKAGQSLKLESAKTQQESLEKAVKEGKISAENAAGNFERIGKIPAFVRFEIVELQVNND